MTYPHSLLFWHGSFHSRGFVFAGFLRGEGADVSLPSQKTLRKSNVFPMTLLNQVANRNPSVPTLLLRISFPSPTSWSACCLSFWPDFESYSVPYIAFLIVNRQDKLIILSTVRLSVEHFEDSITLDPLRFHRGHDDWNSLSQWLDFYWLHCSLRYL